MTSRGTFPRIFNSLYNHTVKMNATKLYNLLLDAKAKTIKRKSMTNKFEKTCELMPYLPQCKVYDV